VGFGGEANELTFDVIKKREMNAERRVSW